MKFEKMFMIAGATTVIGVFFAFASLQNTGLGTANEPEPAAVTTTPTTDKQMVFSDEFDGTELNESKWTTCYDWRRSTETGCTNHGNFEEQWYTDNQVELHDGYLVLTAQRKATDVVVQGEVKTFKYQSGMISTGAGSVGGQWRWSGLYGYYEARVKFQSGQGIWPAFWLLPVDKQWPPEIDVMEFLGNKPYQILQTVHWPAEDGAKKSDIVTTSDADYSSDWHTYAIDWQEDRIDWYIDDRLTRSYTGPNVPDEQMEVILNLAVGGLLPGNADATTPFPSQMLVDYVRVYQSNDQIRPQQQ